MDRLRLKQAAMTALGALAVALAGCGDDSRSDQGQEEIDFSVLQGGFESIYEPLPSEPVAITNATVLVGNGERIDGGTVIMRDGVIEAVGADVTVPDDVRVIDADGQWVTPGLIDTHSHLGVYPSPGVEAHSDGNEIVGPNTAGVWALHGIWPQDPGFVTAIQGGVTTAMILPGSANIFGGRGVTVKLVPARTAQAMRFPDAPMSLKMACGENPKRVYGSQGRSPYTRMGNIAEMREGFIAGQDYLEEWEEYERKQANGEDADPPTRNLQNETLAGVLNGEIMLHNHCYRADEMNHVLDLAEEMDFQVTAFHHAVEAYKIADRLAETGTCAAMWSDWWGFKMEAFDGIRENIPMVDAAGACAVLHSDSERGIQRLNQEAAKAMAAANRIGMDVTAEEAIRWMTLNAAQALRIDDRTGSLEAGKQADVVIWDGDPFSVYTRTEEVFIDGATIYDRDNPERQPVMDFTVGNQAQGEQ